MKINPRRFPTIIIVTFIVVLLVALLLGLRPGGHGSAASSLLPLLDGAVL